MNKEEKLSARQFLLLSWCALLSPLVRQTPLSLVRLAGAGAWVSALLAAVPLLGMLALLRSLLLRCGEGEGLGYCFLRALGAVPGRLVLALCTLWMLFYAGFVLRSGADRFIATVYPDRRAAPFILVMGALGLMAGLGRLKILGRFAEITAPVLIALFLLLFPGILSHGDRAEPLSLTGADALPILRGVFPAADTLALPALGAFVWGKTKKGSARSWVLGILGTVLLMAALCFSAVAVFGTALTARLYYPFFVLLRNVQPFRLTERVEPLLIAQWVVTDFLLFSLLLHAAEENMKLCLGGGEGGRTRRLLAALFTALLSAFLCADSSFALIRLSSTLIPAGNAVLLFGVLPTIWCVGQLRHTI